MDENFKKILEKHHAVLFETTIPLALELNSILSKENDVFFLDKNEIGMAEALLIKENAFLKASFGNRIILISTNKFGREAEQSLLKILEEPPVGTKLLFIVPNTKIFSPTILSRVIKIKGETLGISKDVEKFLKTIYTDRLKMVEIMLKDEDFNMLSFLSEIEKIISERDLIKDKDWQEAIKDIWQSKKALQISGTSKKQILEFTALMLPKI